MQSVRNPEETTVLKDKQIAEEPSCDMDTAINETKKTINCQEERTFFQEFSEI